ncbi:MAG: LutC/YkgG family protein [Planctomycetota bacterium]
MNSRQEILNALNNTRLGQVELPDVEREWNTVPDPKARFLQVLESVGGRAVEISDPESIKASLRRIEAYREAKNIHSSVSGVSSAGGHWGQLTDPHEFEPLECCVIRGEFAVAENGAVWLTQAAVPCRAALFLTQHLVLVVPSSEIVQNMHEAYARISFEHVPFGLFISGPSKTADIEQSLVIGAHGARSLTVLLVDNLVA